MGTSIQRDSVLVVDDEEVVCRALDMLLCRAGDVVFAFAIAHQPHLSRATFFVTTRRCFWIASPSN